MSPSFSRFSYQGIPLQVTVEGLGKLAYGKQVLDLPGSSEGLWYVWTRTRVSPDIGSELLIV